MRKACLWALVLVLCITPVHLVTAQDGTGEPVAEWQPVAVWTATDLATLFGIPVGTGPRLSPDGMRLAWIAAKYHAVCTGEIDTWEVTCTPLPDELKAADLFWSPDSRLIATHSEVLRSMNEPDIWLFEPESGALTNLTDDGFDGNILQDAGALVDITPTWDPITNDLYFFRTVRSDSIFNGLYRIAAGEDGIPSGEPELAVDLSDTFTEGLPVYRNTLTYPLDGGAAISPDGRTMAVIAVPGGRVMDAAIWLIDLADGTLSEAASAGDILPVGLPEWADPLRTMLGGLTWLPDGSGLVVCTLEQPDPSSIRIVRIIDLASGAITPLIDFSAAPSLEAFMSDAGPYGAEWLYDKMYAPVLFPDGSAVLYRNPTLHDQGDFSAVTLPAGDAPIRVLSGTGAITSAQAIHQGSIGQSGDSLHIWIADRLIAFERAG